LPLAVACEGAMLVGFLYVPPLAGILGHALPNQTSCLVALMAIPAVLTTDVIQKHYKNWVRTRRRHTREP
jgi:hypothetical protein